jgi:hypothetical protein
MTWRKARFGFFRYDSGYDRVAPTFPRLDGQCFPLTRGPRPRKPGTPSTINGSARATTSPSIDCPVAVAALPASVDLRQAWWDVGDQGQTGSCVGWASADGVVRYDMVHSNKLAKTEKLFPRYVWMASKETDEYILRPESFVEQDQSVDFECQQGDHDCAVFPADIHRGLEQGARMS